jgi:hypothetical protein
MSTIQIPTLIQSQRESWASLIKIAQVIHADWILIGGQLVQLHCWERDVTPPRVTTDVDTVLNVISEPEILMKFTNVLKNLGFTPKTSPDGHQYKWVRDMAEIDILAPSKIGHRAASKIGISGGTIPETPGGRTVFDFSEKIRVSMDGEEAMIIRPNLIGALYIKSVAMENYHDIGQARHLYDFAVLATLFSSEDNTGQIQKKVNNKISSGIARLRRENKIILQIDGCSEALQRLEMAIDLE